MIAETGAANKMKVRFTAAPPLDPQAK